MVTVAVCEDEPHLRGALEKKLRAWLAGHALPGEVVSYACGETLLADSRSFDVLLMDVRLDGLDGVQTVRRLRRMGAGGQVVFLTAFPQHVFDVFELDAVHYLLKPISDEVLFRALDRALERAAGRKQSLPIPTGSGVRLIPFRSILYCEVLDHTITLHTLAGRLDYLGSLSTLEETLDRRFFRCHKSYLVNLDCVSSQTGTAALLANGATIPVARRRREAFLCALLARVRNEVSL